MIRRLGVFLVLLALAANAAAEEPRPGETLNWARMKQLSAYEFCRSKGAKLEDVGGGKSFVVWYQPEGFDPSEGITFVSLHGHAGWATQDFKVWQEEIQKRGWAYLGVQWWHGKTVEMQGYAEPEEILAWIDEALQRHRVPKQRVIFMGFSMGSARMYAIAYVNRQRAGKDFAVNIANSGALAEDYPSNRGLLGGRSGQTPLSGTHWILYCSEHDMERPDACERMDRTETLLIELGAEVDLFTRDTLGGHGGFMQPGVRRIALNVAEKILKGEGT